MNLFCMNSLLFNSLFFLYFFCGAGDWILCKLGKRFMFPAHKLTCLKFIIACFMLEVMLCLRECPTCTWEESAFCCYWMGHFWDMLGIVDLYCHSHLISLLIFYLAILSTIQICLLKFLIVYFACFSLQNCHFLLFKFLLFFCSTHSL